MPHRWLPIHVLTQNNEPSGVDAIYHRWLPIPVLIQNNKPSGVDAMSHK